MILFFISRATALVRFVFCPLRACTKIKLDPTTGMVTVLIIQMEKWFEF